MKGAIYVRSGVRHAYAGPPIARAIGRCRRAAARRRIDVSPSDVFVELALGNSLHAPAFDDMINAARDKRFDVILIESLDRLSRNPAVLSCLLGLLKAAGVRVLVLEDHR
jgi:DNA invertase Pin-like site-specific DNA recombinase